MNVCLISQEYPPETGGGGIGTQTFLKAHGLTARGHTVHVVSASRNHEGLTYKDGAVVVHRIGQPVLKIPGYELSTSWLAYSAAVADKLHELAQELSFDIMQFPEYGGEGLVYQTDMFAHRAARFVVQMHGPLGMFADHMGWPDVGSTLHQVGCFMERTVLHHADKLLASSLNTASYCARKYGIELTDVLVIHSAVDLERFRPAPQQDSEPGPRILFVGNVAENKGVGILMTAVLQARRSWPGIQVGLIGTGDNHYVTELQREIDAHGARQHFRFLGHVPHSSLPEWYSWCHMFVGPSFFEPGPGNIYLEAMACGRPVVACNSGGTPEVVLDRETGLLVTPDDARALCDAIQSLAGDAELRARLGRQGREWVASKFSTKRYIDRVEQVYACLCSR